MIAERIEPLKPEENAIVRDMIDGWPRVKAAAARQSFNEWYTGVMARNPKLSQGLTAVATLALAALAAWLSGLVSPAQPREVVPVVVPVESKSEPEVKPKKMPPAKVMQPAPVEPITAAEPESVDLHKLFSDAFGEPHAKQATAQEEPEFEPPSPWLMWRDLPGKTWADYPQPDAKLNALERKVK